METLETHAKVHLPLALSKYFLVLGNSSMFFLRGFCVYMLYVVICHYIFPSLTYTHELYQ